MSAPPPEPQVTSGPGDCARDGGESLQVATTRTFDHLRATRAWVRFLSVLGFVVSGCLALVFALMLAGTGAANHTAALSVAPAVAASLLGAAFYFVPSFLLHRYAGAIDAFLASREMVELEGLLARQRAFWRFMGVLAATCLGLAFLGLVARGFTLESEGRSAGVGLRADASVLLAGAQAIPLASEAALVCEDAAQLPGGSPLRARQERLCKILTDAERAVVSPDQAPAGTSAPSPNHYAFVVYAPADDLPFEVGPLLPSACDSLESAARSAFIATRRCAPYATREASGAGSQRP